MCLRWQVSKMDVCRGGGGGDSSLPLSLSALVSSHGLSLDLEPTA